MLIFEHSKVGRHAAAQAPTPTDNPVNIPKELQRTSDLGLPQVSELDVVRHYTRLSQKNFSIDTHFYPLGSCTMKYNPRACNSLAMREEFLSRHPLAPISLSQGTLSCMFDLQEILQDVTGLDAVSLTPMAGAQGEFSGIAMIKAYHEDRGDVERNEIIVPDAAHGTNPASAVMAGMKVVAIKCDERGDIDMNDLRDKATTHAGQLSALMITYPSTHGVFESTIREVCDIIHDHGGQVYMDGANMNAQVGLTSPGRCGADVCHLNLHKTFCIPHGGGGPGMGPIGVAPQLVPFLPEHPVERPDTAGEFAIGPVSAAPYGSPSILTICLLYTSPSPRD